MVKETDKLDLYNQVESIKDLIRAEVNEQDLICEVYILLINLENAIHNNLYIRNRNK